ncbi:unnamed protein product [Lampetra planeri]
MLSFADPDDEFPAHSVVGGGGGGVGYGGDGSALYGLRSFPATLEYDSFRGGRRKTEREKRRSEIAGSRGRDDG